MHVYACVCMRVCHSQGQADMHFQGQPSVVSPEVYVCVCVCVCMRVCVCVYACVPQSGTS